MDSRPGRVRVSISIPKETGHRAIPAKRWMGREGKKREKQDEKRQLKLPQEEEQEVGRPKNEDDATIDEKQRRGRREEKGRECMVGGMNAYRDLPARKCTSTVRDAFDRRRQGLAAGSRAAGRHGWV